MKELTAQLRQLSAEGFGLLITGSRRTGAAAIGYLRKELADCRAFISDGSGDNPYFGMLAHADAFVVTCEFCEYDYRSLQHRQTGARNRPSGAGPARGGGRDKFARFHRSLEESGRIRSFKGQMRSGPTRRCAKWSGSHISFRRRICPGRAVHPDPPPHNCYKPFVDIRLRTN